MLKVLEIIKKYIEKRKIDVKKIDLKVLLKQDEKAFRNILLEEDTNKQISLIYLYSNETFNSKENKHKMK